MRVTTQLISANGIWPTARTDRYRLSSGGGYDYWLASNLLEFTSDAYDLVMYDNDGEPQKLPGYRVDAQTDAMISYINEHQTAPFFMFSSFIEPHHQNHRDDYPASSRIL